MTRRGFFQQHSVTASCICSNALFSICRMRSAETFFSRKLSQSHFFGAVIQPAYLNDVSTAFVQNRKCFGKLVCFSPGFVGAGNQGPRITPEVGKHLGGSQCPYVVIISASASNDTSTPVMRISISRTVPNLHPTHRPSRRLRPASSSQDGVCSSAD
ncbi:MAG: hypothetical protein Ct9H300mP16_13960 [Pseudomonadota bacterium]|nr:MAG: hypothetical protein Ct9H300mP16_13960 [Pseudomonadota bacterium]